MIHFNTNFLSRSLSLGRSLLSLFRLFFILLARVFGGFD